MFVYDFCHVHFYLGQLVTDDTDKTSTSRQWPQFDKKWSFPYTQTYFNEYTSLINDKCTKYVIYNNIRIILARLTVNVIKNHNFSILIVAINFRNQLVLIFLEKCKWIKIYTYLILIGNNSGHRLCYFPNENLHFPEGNDDIKK